MTSRSDDSQAACCLHFWSKLNICTTTSHIGSNCDSTQQTFFVVNESLCTLSFKCCIRALDALICGINQLLLIAKCRRLVGESLSVASHPHDAFGALSCLGNNHCLLLMEFSIQDLMRDFAHSKHLRKQLTDFNRSSAYQARTSLHTHVLDFLDYRTILFTIGLVYAIVHVISDHGLIGRYLYHIELVDIPELTGFCTSGTSHTGKFMIHTEIVLERDGSESLCCSFHFDMLFSLNSLM